MTYNIHASVKAPQHVVNGNSDMFGFGKKPKPTETDEENCPIDDTVLLKIINKNSGAWKKLPYRERKNFMDAVSSGSPEASVEELPSPIARRVNTLRALRDTVRKNEL